MKIEEFTKLTGGIRPKLGEWEIIEVVYEYHPIFTVDWAPTLARKYVAEGFESIEALLEKALKVKELTETIGQLEQRLEKRRVELYKLRTEYNL